MANTVNSSAEGCDYKSGSLPECAPLAAPYVPMQSSSTPQYSSAEALAKGTLFPGLNLPFKNITNQPTAPNTPLDELMAVNFVLDELGLYLDTHPNDSEALEMFTRFSSLYSEGVKKYTETYGPLTQTQVTSAGYTWIDSPWPWEYVGGNNK